MVFSSIQASFRLFGPNHRKHLLTICNVLAFEPLRIVPQVLSKLDTTLCTLCKLGMAAMKAFLLRCRIRTYTVLRSQERARTHSSLTQAQTLACCTTTAQQQHRNFPLVFNSIIIQTANPTFLIYLKHHHLMLEWAKKYVHNHFFDISLCKK